MRFGGYELPHAQRQQTSTGWEVKTTAVPSRDKSYRKKITNEGKSMTIEGLDDFGTQYKAWTFIDQIRSLVDGVARTFDPEDDTPTWSAKATDPEFHLNVEKWRPGAYRVVFSITFIESE